MSLLQNANRREVLISSGIFIAGLCLLAYGVLIEPAQLLMNKQTLRVPHWSSFLNHLKVVVLSDLHVGSLHITVEKLHEIVQKANEQKPDLILLLGDYVASQGRRAHMKPELFVHELDGLQAKYGVYCVLGNHDWWYNGEDVRSQLEKTHIHVLEDSSEKIDIGGAPLWIAGLGDEWTRGSNIQKALAAVPPKSPCLLMMHNPDLFAEVPNTVSLSMAGHTHGGQVSLPLIGPPIVPSKWNGRYARGLIVENGKSLFVTSGIGTSVFPIRIGVPPEICVLDLNEQGASK